MKKMLFRKKRIFAKNEKNAASANAKESIYKRFFSAGKEAKQRPWGLGRVFITAMVL